MVTYKLEDVGKDVDYLKDVVKDIQQSDKEQTKLLNNMNTSIAVIETSVESMSKSFDNIGKSIAWFAGGIGVVVTALTLLNMLIQ